MTEVEKRTKALAACIKKCSQQREYTKAYERLCTQPDVLRQVNRFRKKYFLALGLEDREERKQAVGQLEEEFSEVLSMSAVRDFLAAQQKLSVMIQEVYHILDDAVNLDLGFMFEPEEEQ